MLIEQFLPNIQIKGLTSDSRKVRPGYVFAAYPGLTVDGRDYIQQAVANGAAGVLYEADNAVVDVQYEVACVPVKNLQQQLGLIAADFYQNSSHDMTVIGVTGTNGKTTVTQFIAQGLQDCAVIGTTGYGFLPQLESVSHTTSDAITLQQQLHALKALGAKAIAMEVSSHALVQHRVSGTKFDIGVFTNLSRDHLDFHKDMQEYADAKFQLFEQPGLKHAVINVDDPVGRTYIDKLAVTVNPVAVSRSQPYKDFPTVFATSIETTSEGFVVKVNTPWGCEQCSTQLIGRFNIDNILAFIAVLGLLGIPLKTIVKKASSLMPVNGRMEVIILPGKPKAVIDFAHTPDALHNALTALREHCQGKLWCIFGCGGDRDPGKRAEMGKIASTLADHIIITNDNPRSEDPKIIAQQIYDGVISGAMPRILLDRKQAIVQTLKQAAVEDIVLIAGKGHENYQIINEQRLPFSDGDIVRSCRA